MRLLAENLPAGPYDVMMNAAGFVYVVDADGKKIAALLGKSDQKEAVAALLIKARAAVVAKAP